MNRFVGVSLVASVLSIGCAHTAVVEVPRLSAQELGFSSAPSPKSPQPMKAVPQAPVVARLAKAEPAKAPEKRIDVTASDLDVGEFLRAMAEMGRVNIVASDDVQGRVTLRLRNVTWSDALDVVLRMKGLAMEKVGSNIVRVAPRQVLLREMKERDQEG